MTSLTKDKLTFKEIEREFYKIGCDVAKMLLQRYLEEMDTELAGSRDKERLRHKGKKTTAIKTLMGEVSVERAIYRKVKDEGSQEYVYLLDEALGLDTIGFMSPNLVEKIVDYSCEMSYRDVAKAVSTLTNQPISHQGVWNIVQAVGEKQSDAEKALVDSFKRNELSGSKEVPVLFEEADGLWLSMQGKSREKGSSKGRKELKLSVTYEGCNQRYPSSKEYKTVGKMAFAGYMTSEEMKCLRDAAVYQRYNVDEIKYRILNGDGASWIRRDHDQETDIFQLDPFHLAQAVTRNVSDKKLRRPLVKWLKAGEFEKVFKKLEELKYESGGVAKEVEKLSTLEQYIKSNLDGIVPYKDREGITLPDAPEGIEYRTLGTMERQVRVFAARMKGGKSWSEKGATHLSKIIALKMGEDFKEKIAGLVSGKLPERFTERYIETLSNSRSGLKKAVKTSLYPVHRGGLPYTNCSVTRGRKAIRNLFNLKTFSEMIYR
ncbi:Hypothetical protein DPCES_5418 [Desulfitobacterium hafniense]|uniref:ISLre2 family transposase n=3 Tax=Desulfitobacterium hafniense TaxID=49338 RepID=A0A098AV04_DESHA|nr:ISLre2 family transposase [Desulfitobacterium hafniense]CDV96416.1 Hypothetical protein DPCES_5418 [Desulfitobacterium hafniense]